MQINEIKFVPLNLLKQIQSFKVGVERVCEIGVGVFPMTDIEKLMGYFTKNSFLKLT